MNNNKTQTLTLFLFSFLYKYTLICIYMHMRYIWVWVYLRMCLSRSPSRKRDRLRDAFKEQTERRLQQLGATLDSLDHRLHSLKTRYRSNRNSNNPDEAQDEDNGVTRMTLIILIITL